MVVESFPVSIAIEYDIAENADKSNSSDKQLRKRPSIEELFTRDRDVLFSVLGLLDPTTLARVSLASRSWNVLGSEERLWEIHCRVEPLCRNSWTPQTIVKNGGWKKFYASRAKEAKLVQELFNERDVVTFRDLWLTTGEILWENVIGPLIPI
mmetsp:Transcript_23414/g.52610  ORF Transcript_23414/g.52610 Transcript_23414/m.52610 type:complete len:153 (-) Transcript_23414:156-614(-)|eukprot:756319-Hanusia_phi.AAC.1